MRGVELAATSLADEQHDEGHDAQEHRSRTSQRDEGPEIQQLDCGEHLGSVWPATAAPRERRCCATGAARDRQTRPVLLAAGRIPNLEARALAPTIGWLTLICVLAFVALCVIHRDRWKRLWLRSEDPRALGLFRIVFGTLVLLNFGGLSEQLIFLFTDEGLFLTESARQVLASAQFAGFGDGFGDDPHGFFDAAGALTFLKGPKWSLLWFWDSPSAMWAQLGVFIAVTVLFTVGWKTRLMGVLSFLLMNSFALRNPIYWSGADVVYRCFFFYLILARSGHAYSIDNWLRRRKDPDAPVHRCIPAWPRMLMMLQLATIYFWTGCAKTGSVWWRGDSLYYALNLDHFYRVPSQFLASVFGTNVFRLMTWTVHFWQIGFPLLIAGLVVRWGIREGIKPPTGWRLHFTRMLWAVIGVGALAICVVALPVHYEQGRGGWPVQRVQAVVAVCWILGLGAIGMGWRRLRDRPPKVRLRGKEYTLDLEWFCSWFLGRRLWLTIGVFFHVQILFLMNIGMFAPIMLGAYLCCLNGTEVATALRGLGRALARLRIPPFKGMDFSAPIVPAEPPESGWAYGRIGRWIVGTVVAWHIAAVAAWSIPDKDCTYSFRKPAREMVGWWLKTTQTSQSWNMFAPNPIRTNVFLKVMITDQDGETWDMRTDANSPRHKEVPWLFYDRAGKITRRVLGDGKWYQKWYARYHCRQWALEHGGEAPEKVQLIKLWYRIPPPEEMRDRGYYRPAEMLARHGRESEVFSERCRTSVDAQLPNRIRERHGLPLLPEEEIRRWHKHRRRKWEKR